MCYLMIIEYKYWCVSCYNCIEIETQNKNHGVFVKHYAPPPPPRRQQSLKAIFRYKVIDIGVIWKGVSGVCMPNMKSPSLTVQKL